MRHLRTRKRFRVVLIMLFALCVTLFAETRIEAFAPQVKDMIELRAGEALGGKMKLTINGIEGGILHPLSFSGITLKDGKDAAVFTSIVIDSIRTNCRVWDLLFRRGEGASFTDMLSRDSFVYVSFETKDRAHAGFVRVEGDLRDARIKGYVRVAGGERIDVSARVMAGKRFAAVLRSRYGGVRAYGRMTADGGIAMNVQSERLVLRGVPVTADVVARTRFTACPGRPGIRRAAGEFRSRRLTVSGKDLPEIRCAYALAGEVLSVSRFTVGDILKVSGVAVLRDPYRIEATVVIEPVAMSRLFALAGAEDMGRHFAGTLSGRITVSGFLKDIKSLAHLEVRRGRLFKLDFDSMTAVLKGDGPILRVEDGRIVRDSGSIIIEGEIDAGKLGRGTAFERLRIAGDDCAMNWDALGSASWQGGRQERMDKKVADGLHVGFRKFVNDEKIDESARTGDEMRLEYALNDGDSIAMSVQDGGGFVGLQHKDKF